MSYFHDKFLGQAILKGKFWLITTQTTNQTGCKQTNLSLERKGRSKLNQKVSLYTAMDVCNGLFGITFTAVSSSYYNAMFLHTKIQAINVLSTIVLLKTEIMAQTIKLPLIYYLDSFWASTTSF